MSGQTRGSRSPTENLLCKRCDRIFELSLRRCKILSMGRRRRNREADLFEVIAKGVLGGILLLSLAIGGVQGFPAVFGELVRLILWLIVATLAVAVVGVAIYFGVRCYRAKQTTTTQSTPWPNVTPEVIASRPLVLERQQATPSPAPAWSSKLIEASLGEIDWYQFEKFCAALLRSEGYTVERRGGAQPDGGVDLVAVKEGESMLVQCKHWRTWTVQDKVIRELLGSMAHFKVSRGALYTLKGWTQPAAAFAAQHAITLVDGRALAARAKAQLTDTQLDGLLKTHEHHCPKCEARMIWRTGNFEPFWGCSNFPRCRSILRHSGAR